MSLDACLLSAVSKSAGQICIMKAQGSCHFSGVDRMLVCEIKSRQYKTILLALLSGKVL